MTVRLMRSRNGIAAISIAAMAVVGGGSSSVAAPGDAGTAVDAPGGAVTVDVVTVNGSGCPAGTASVKPLADNTGFTVSYSEFAASANGGSEPTDFRKNCQIALQVNVPQGFTYAIAQADYYGYARLAKGTTGLERSNYYFQGSSEDNYVDHEFTGPLYGRWHVTDSVTEAALVYAPCGTSRILNVNSELRVLDGTSTAASSLTMTKSSGDVNTLYHFSWKQC
jgi:hypothetical protein